jgi:hypothetical protein
MSSSIARLRVKDAVNCVWWLANTKWNIGTVDAAGSLKALVEALYPDVTEPYRLIEYLINEGLRLLNVRDAVPPDVVGLLFAAAEIEVTQKEQT